jgi:hypothetical protein
MARISVVRPGTNTILCEARGFIYIQFEVKSELIVLRLYFLLPMYLSFLPNIHSHLSFVPTHSPIFPSFLYVGSPTFPINLPMYLPSFRKYHLPNFFCP